MTAWELIVVKPKVILCKLTISVVIYSEINETDKIISDLKDLIDPYLGAPSMLGM